MSERTRTCPHGHQWELPADRAAGAHETCPMCGAVADTLLPGTSIPETLPPGAASADAPQPEPPDAAAPRVALPAIPGYEIAAELGRGGMGVVYRAQQKSLRRDVALKMVVAGPLASPSVLARFRTEAEAVAQLAHPNIVQIYEVGEAAGHAFFSMEYVAGGTLADRSQAGPQPPRAAAQIVAALARAVSFAHQRGVIHRDLKPANVLVTLDGTPKIADFGLARLAAAESRQTFTGDVMGSPSYMAPEQARGATQQIGPSCDIYALGAILYELLTGRPPFAGQDTMETLLLVLHEDPLPPRRLAPRIPRDIETICLKCLEKSPRLRYATADELALDLDRFLAGRAVVARPAGPAELLVKWARRRPAVAALVAVVVASAATLLSYSAWKNAQLRTALGREQAQREHAESNFRKALDVADRRLTRAGQDPQKLLAEELAFYDEILAQSGDDAQIRYERGMAARRAGDVHRLLGHALQAADAYRQAIDLLTILSAAAPGNEDYRRDLAAAHNGLAQLHHDAGRLEESETQLRDAAKLFEELSHDNPREVDYRKQWGIVLNNLAIGLNKQGKSAEAEAAHQQALALRRQLAAEFPDEGGFRLDQAISEANLGALYNRMGKHDEALRALHEALALREGLPPSYSAEAEFRRATTGIFNNLGVALAATGRAAEARDAYEQVIETLLKLSADYPAVPAYSSMLADSHTNLALHDLRNGRAAAARRSLVASLAVWDVLAADDPQSTAYAASRDEVRRLLDKLDGAGEEPPATTTPGP